MSDRAEELFAAQFKPGRTPRSEEYKSGVRMLLRRLIHSAEFRCPYPEGSVQMDAFFAGVEEGWIIWRQSQRSEEAAS